MPKNELAPEHKLKFKMFAAKNLFLQNFWIKLLKHFFELLNVLDAGACTIKLLQP
jgi:hypothetical protein